MVEVGLRRTVGRVWASEPARAGLVRALSLASSAFFSFLQTRLILTSAGVEVFALVTLVVSMGLLLPYADLGIGAAVINVVARSERPDSDASVRKTISASARALWLVATIAVVLIVLAAWVGWLSRALAVPRSNGTDWTVALVLVCFALAVPLGLGQRLLLGLGRNDLVVALQASTAPLTVVGTLALLQLNAPSRSLVLPPAVAFLCTALVTAVVALRKTRLPLRLFLGSSEPGRARLAQTAGPMFLITLGTSVAVLSDRLVLSHRSTAAAIAAYSVGAQLALPFNSVVGTVGTSLWPFFARRRRRSSQPILRRLIGVFMLCGVFFALVLVAVGRPVAAFVTDGAVVPSVGLLAAFALLLVVQATHYPSGTYLTEPAGLRFQAACVGIMVPTNLALSWWLAAGAGAAGPVLASALTIGLFQAIPTAVRALREERDQPATT